MRLAKNYLAASFVALCLAAPAVAQELGADCDGSKSYVDLVQGHESGGDYQIMNPDGAAAGAYQFMPKTLAGLGYATMPANYDRWNGMKWTGKDGVHSLQDFLNSRTAQDNAFRQFTQENLRSVQGQWTPGQVVNGIPLTEGGVALAVHMLGPGGFKSWASGGFRPEAIQARQAAQNGGAQAMHNHLMKRLADGACADPNDITGGGVDEIDNMPYFYLMPWEPRHRAPVVMPGDFVSLR